MEEVCTRTASPEFNAQNLNPDTTDAFSEKGLLGKE
jgi:hypothetical protein